MKIHLFFEQSGTFKNVFKEMGYKAYDYDIENRFNETDFQLDLFREIENAWANHHSVFDNIDENDLIFAFFPCTYFSAQNQLFEKGQSSAFKNWTKEKIREYWEERKKERKKYLEILKKLVDTVKQRKIKTVIENPYHQNYLLTLKEFASPAVIIKNRRIYGDFYKKPTMFYFYNFECTFFSNTAIKLKHYKTKIMYKVRGIERSVMTKEFAYNFVNKYIFGKG